MNNKKMPRISETVLRVQKNFINKRVKPTVGTPDFLSVIGSITASITYNGQYYGDTLTKIYNKYKFCAWLPMALFKMGYLQALVDIGRGVPFNLNYSDEATVNKAVLLLTGKDFKAN